MNAAISNFFNTVLPFAVVIHHIDPNCTYYQELAFGQVYYIFNKEYPQNYSAQSGCQWMAVSPPNSKIVLSCGDVLMPSSLNCFQDRIELSSSENDQHKYCGNGAFTFVTQENNLNFVLRATRWSKGGRFSCSITAIQTPKEETQNIFQKPAEASPCRCGWKNDKRIFGGHETLVNEYPAMAALISSANGVVFCGGTIISQSYVLTAAHCVSNINANQFFVLVGDHDVSLGTDTSSSAIYRALNIVIHPRYNQAKYQQDLALINVNKIAFNDNVGPICLPFRYSSDTFVGEEVAVLGWGQLEFQGPYSNTLQEADMRIITNSECQQNNTQDEIIFSEVCTYAPDMDSCQSDSGGPVFWQNEYKKLYVIGVISQGKPCGLPFAGINTRVTSFLDWILHSTGAETYCIA